MRQPGTSIDEFLNRRLNDIGLSPAPLADRRTLLRRITFDLTGLPPSPEEIAAFSNDPDSDDKAFAKIVDRLLASPHYGERMAQHWLDATRYADSSGYANDYERGTAWRGGTAITWCGASTKTSPTTGSSASNSRGTRSTRRIRKP